MVSDSCVWTVFHVHGSENWVGVRDEGLEVRLGGEMLGVWFGLIYYARIIPSLAYLPPSYLDRNPNSLLIETSLLYENHLFHSPNPNLS